MKMTIFLGTNYRCSSPFPHVKKNLEDSWCKKWCLCHHSVAPPWWLGPLVAKSIHSQPPGRCRIDAPKCHGAEIDTLPGRRCRFSLDIFCFGGANVESGKLRRERERLTKQFVKKTEKTKKKNRSWKSDPTRSLPLGSRNAPTSHFLHRRDGQYASVKHSSPRSQQESATSTTCCQLSSFQVSRLSRKPSFRINSLVPKVRHKAQWNTTKPAKWCLPDGPSSFHVSKAGCKATRTARVVTSSWRGETPKINMIKRFQMNIKSRMVSRVSNDE